MICLFRFDAQRFVQELFEQQDWLQTVGVDLIQSAKIAVLLLPN